MKKRPFKKQTGRVTQNHFDSIKLLASTGASKKFIAEALHLGESTVSALARAETFQAYQEKTREAIRKYKEGKLVEAVVTEAVAEISEPETENIITPSLEGILREIQMTNKLLRELQNTQTQASKGWFRK